MGEGDHYTELIFLLFVWLVCFVLAFVLIESFRTKYLV